MTLKPDAVNSPNIPVTASTLSGWNWMLENAAKQAGLSCMTPPEPFRWSEDFGHYGSRCPAFFCGIGGGEDAAGLHTPDYRWNDTVTDAAIHLFSTLIHI